MENYSYKRKAVNSTTTFILENFQVETSDKIFLERSLCQNLTCHFLFLTQRMRMVMLSCAPSETG